MSMVAVIFQLWKTTAFTATTKATKFIMTPRLMTQPAPVKTLGLAVASERVWLGTTVSALLPFFVVVEEGRGFEVMVSTPVDTLGGRVGIGVMVLLSTEREDETEKAVGVGRE